MEKAIFTDKELEYIYNNIDLDIDPIIVRAIEKKIRKQIEKYYYIDKFNKSKTRMLTIT